MKGVTIVLLFLLLTFITCLSGVFVTSKLKQTVRTKRSSHRGHVGHQNDKFVKEKYVTGICKQGTDDLHLYNVTHETCITECRSRTMCSSINVYMKVNYCRLNFHPDIPEAACPKYIYSEKANWTKKWENGCEKLSCLINEKCVTIDGIPSCKPSECTNIRSPDNGVVFGKHVNFGKSRGFQCDRGFTLIGASKITCLTSGQWSADVPTCTETPLEEIKMTTTDSTLLYYDYYDQEHRSPRTLLHDTSTVNQYGFASHDIDFEYSIETVTPNKSNVDLSNDNAATTTEHFKIQTYPKYENQTSTPRPNSPWSPFWGISVPTTQAPKTPGLTTFVRPYPMICSPITPCIDVNQQCIQGICQCIFGFLYDQSTDRCETTTTTTNWYDTYTDCTTGWLSGLGQCYYLVETESTFEDANTYCEQKGGHLAEPETDSDNDFIKKIIRDESREDDVWWFGLKYDGTDWVWHSTGVTPTYTDWMDGHPVTDTDRNTTVTPQYINGLYNTRNTYRYMCAAYYHKDEAWISKSCDEKFYSVCEKELWYF